MRTIVTTHWDAVDLLSPFFKLASKFYPVSMQVDVASREEEKSDQLIRLLSDIADDYLILLEEDFYFVGPVPIVLLDIICEWCIRHGADRFSLQSKNAHQFSDWPMTDEVISGRCVYKYSTEVVVPFALEASVWKKSFLLDYLEPGWNDGEIEVLASNKIRHLSHSVYALDRIVMDYRDGMRGGSRVIQLLEDPLRLRVNSDNALALYPQGGGSEVLFLQYGFR